MASLMKKESHRYEHHKTKLGKVWHFLSHEDSWQSFLVDAALILLIGKYLVFPTIGFALDTNYPLVAVVSGSMDHHGQEFDEWWEDNGQWYLNHNITKEQFKEYHKSEGFRKGDVFVVKGLDSEKVKVGDVLIYTTEGRRDPIIHRVVTLNEDGTFATKGDANMDQLTFEKSINLSQIHGKSVVWVPFIGWVKVALIDFINSIMRR